MSEADEYRQLVREYRRLRCEPPVDREAKAAWRQDLARLGRIIDRYHASRPLIGLDEWLLDMRVNV